MRASSSAASALLPTRKNWGAGASVLALVGVSLLTRSLIGLLSLYHMALTARGLFRTVLERLVLSNLFGAFSCKGACHAEVITACLDLWPTECDGPAVGERRRPGTVEIGCSERCGNESWHHAREHERHCVCALGGSVRYRSPGRHLSHQAR